MRTADWTTVYCITDKGSADSLGGKFESVTARITGRSWPRRRGEGVSVGAVCSCARSRRTRMAK